MKKLLTLLIIYPIAGLVALRVGATLADLTSIGAYVAQVHPVLVVSTLAAGFAVASFLMGALTGDYSWVDRLWSTAPVAFAWVYAARASFAPPVTFAAVLVTIWGLRLTFNFARRGGYSTLEDYRWPILRERIRNPILWQLFNLLFISGFQVGLFILFTAPVHRLATLGTPVASVTMTGAALLFLILLAIETVADQHQWTFQNIKYGGRPKEDVPGWFGTASYAPSEGLAADLQRGFLTHGLFRLSRHPNYFGELGVWWTLYLFASVAAGGFLHWSGLGVVLLTALFVGSTRFTESISAARYHRYADYQAWTSAIIPWPSSRPVAGEEATEGDGAAGDS